MEVGFSNLIFYAKFFLRETRILRQDKVKSFKSLMEVGSDNLIFLTKIFSKRDKNLEGRTTANLSNPRWKKVLLIYFVVANFVNQAL
jgi:hypothetical protein